MPEARPPATLQFSRRISVETPEHVVLQLELAGLGSRMAAAIYDLITLVLLLVIVSLAFSLAGGLQVALGGWAGAFLVIVSFVLFWGYFTLFEAFNGGRTPGKWRVGIRVVMDTGHPVTLPASFIRNLIRLVDIQPLGTHLVGLLFVFLQPNHKRLGDIVAGTIVVRDRPEDLTLAAPLPAPVEQLDAGPPILSDDEFRLLEQFIARLDELAPTVRSRLAYDMGYRFAERFPKRGPADPPPAGDNVTEAALIQLYDAELTRRHARTAARHGTSGVAASGTAERFVALKQQDWERFRHRASLLEKEGLRTLEGEDVVRFAAEYREAAADLARARTYGVDPRVLAYLERIVGAGHNALYGLRGVRRLPLGRLLFHELPAAVYQARWYVLTATLLFLLPGIVGYALVRERPEIAPQILPDVMIARAESGEYERAAGRGYAETPSPYLPFVASSIITNNVQVAFGAFAFGITAGVGTVVVLVFNGLFFGAVLGLFANYRLAGWILTFVAGHGVLELTAIFIAGAGGLLVGRALVAPGDLARRDALVVYGRSAIRLVGAAACLLVVAGLIEGFLSASAAPAPLKLAVSAASVVVVVMYFAVGRRATLA
ncbi:MAG: stage II sporulation protein M [Gemmatimonadales bacterium]